MSDRFFRVKREQRGSRLSGSRWSSGPERLESRALCAAQPLNSAQWAPVALDIVPWTVAAPEYFDNATTSRLVAANASTPTDDRYEQNDSRATATNLGTITASTTVSQLVMADRADWFRFTMSTTGKATDRTSIDFKHAQGDLDMALYNSRGQRLKLSNGVVDGEQVSLAGLPAGTYYAVVYGYNGALNPNYSLTFAAGAGTTGTTGTNSNPITTSAGSTATNPTATGGFNIEFAFSGLTATQQAIFEQAALKWESIIVGDLPNATYNGRVVDDLLIQATAVSIDGRGNVLGEAGPDRFRGGSNLPYHGVMRFDTADLASMQADGSLLGVIEHEMGHVLGIGTLWQSEGLVAGAGTSNPRFVGPHAVAEYNATFGTNATGVPLETGGGPGTRDAHWSESLFGSEIMTGYVGPSSSMPLSRITVASLADLGYTVNIAAADPFTPSGSSARSTSNSGTGQGTGTGAGLVQTTPTSVVHSPRHTPTIAPRAVDWILGRGWSNWLTWG